MPMNPFETITAVEYRYTVLFQPESEGGYTVTCPTLQSARKRCA